MTTGEIERDKGIEQAVKSAESKHEEWKEIAYKAFVEWIEAKTTNHSFLLEDFREQAKSVPEPPSKRAYGYLTIRAAKDGLIRKIGYASVKNPKAHAANASLWSKN
jgi:hypothetical protein